ncbi:hypothetical protein Sru01_05880 [Sphaerisporangium rufum]|uniref:Beta propeller domain-containing protein n=1 Tax=Sphaerisporangium rufum TaxID=1381558 RepID=A0A919QWW4_9ACTN|nr:beta-propeller domain-containing protein [Sphaerisporangium rufum]GII75606.1 hypothetical protein Sru01_05880 [Sphaerisporangium rufum]
MRSSIGTAAAALLATGLVAGTAGCSAARPAGAPEQGTPPATLGNIRLVAYSGCDDLLADLRETTARNVTPWGLDGNVIMYDAVGDSAKATARSTAVPEHSTTNVHEAGVDEPDMVKIDGRRVVTFAGGTLRVVDVASRKVTGTLRIAPKDQLWTPGDLLVHGDRALVLISGGFAAADAVRRAGPPPGPKYVLVDLAAMKVLGSISPAGAHVDARMSGSTVRLVVSSRPAITFPEPAQGAAEAAMLERNRQAVRAAPIEAWLPSYQVTGPDGTTERRSVPCGRVSHPDDHTGTSMITVHTLDLAADPGTALGGAEPVSVVADGDTVYSTAGSLYITSNPNRWFAARKPVPDVPATPAAPASPLVTPGAAATAPSGAVAPKVPPTPEGDEKVAPQVPPTPAETAVPADPTVAPKVPASPDPDQKIVPTADPSMPTLRPEATPPGPPPQETQVHRFDVTGPGSPRYVTSAVVPGRLLNQYALSEYEGHLRIATTMSDEGGWVRPTPDRSESAVYVLRADTLARTGEVTGLGTGERIYSVRFIGPVGYVVTFRQVDPLYTLDLRDPARPRVTGELKISGYSAYLHPAGDGRLIGVGQEANGQGRVQGAQVSLFDVGDPARPVLLARHHRKNSASESEWDPHAFLYWPATRLAVLPITSWGKDGTEPRVGAVALRIGDREITEIGTITHPKVTRGDDGTMIDPAIRRCLVIGDTLWTVSDAGLRISDLTTLAERGHIPFAS